VSTIAFVYPTLVDIHRIHQLMAVVVVHEMLAVIT
jgi:hypothetical protein